MTNSAYYVNQNVVPGLSGIVQEDPLLGNYMMRCVNQETKYDIMLSGAESDMNVITYRKGGLNCVGGYVAE